MIRNRQAQFEEQMRKRTTQVRVNKGFIVEGHGAGTILWMAPERARMFVDMMAVSIIGAPGPGETKPAGPQEIKPAGPQEGAATEGKSSGAPSIGPSIGSASSNEGGKDEQSSASEGDQASEPIKSSSSDEPGSGMPAALSQSTTRISLRRGQTSSTSRTPAGGNGTEPGTNS